MKRALKRAHVLVRKVGIGTLTYDFRGRRAWREKRAYVLFPWAPVGSVANYYFAEILLWFGPSPGFFEWG